MTGDKLDDLLATGGFRSQQSVFPNNVLETDVIKNHDYLNYLLRIRLHDVKYKKSQKKVYNGNKSFKVEVKLALVTDEVENLFKLYKERIDFETTNTVYRWFF